jgi:hypothetical protein
MKHLLMRSAKTRYTVYLFLGLILLLFTTIPTQAQEPVHTDEQLFNLARGAYQDREWVTSAMYFTAYIERGPDLMWSNPTHARQVRAAWEYSEDKALGLESDNRELKQELRQCQSSASGGLGSSVSGLTSSPPSLSEAATTTPPSYPLVCRGGGDMYFQYHSYSNLSHKPQIWITFEKGPRGVGQNREYAHVSQHPRQRAEPHRDPQPHRRPGRLLHQLAKWDGTGDQLSLILHQRSATCRPISIL